MTLSKILGKTHAANPYKQGLPEMQDGNEASPLKGIDVISPNSLYYCKLLGVFILDKYNIDTINKE